MKTQIKIGLGVSILTLIAMACIIFYTGTLLPDGDRIPLHFGPDGAPDRFGTRSDALMTLWILPGIMTVVSAIMAVAPFVDPRRDNVRTGRQGYLAVWITVNVVILMVLGGVAFAMVNSASSTFDTSGAVRWVIAACALLFIVMGNYLPKTRSSFVFGIRTPWTLSSDFAWEKTHRLAGPLFMIAGAIGLVGAFLFNGVWLALQLPALVLTITLVCAVYSYLVWRDADDRDTSSQHLV